MSQIREKKGSRLTPRIHRRKNVQIPKEFFCTVSQCGKGYGSYAALYTHMKNKHTNIKPPNMPNGVKVKNAPQGRPKIKKNEQQKIQEEEKVFCKICMEVECQCVQDFDSDEKNKTLQIMSSEKFINFVSQVGSLVGEDDFSWVRRTDQEYKFKSEQQIKQDTQKFKSKFSLDLILSQKLKQFLSFSSKYWNPQYIDELYEIIYASLAFQNFEATCDFIKDNDFENMIGCINNNQAVFQRFQNLIRII